MFGLAGTIFLRFPGTGPANALLILDPAAVSLRAGATPLSIFMIHLFGDLWSPEIIGRQSDARGDLQNVVLILPWSLSSPEGSGWCWPSNR